MGRFKNMAVVLLIMAAMVLFSSISVFASGFSVTVPLSLPIQQTSDGELVFAEGLVIKNNCSMDDVKVTNITLTTSAAWSLIDYSSEPSESDNEFALQINGNSFNADGSYPLVEDDWVIPNNSSLDLTYSAKSSLIEEGESVILGNVVFTVDIKPYEVEIPDDADDYFVPEENLSGEKADSLWVWYVDSDDNEAHITNYLGEYSENLELVVPTTLDGQYSPNGPAKVVSMEAGNFADKTLKSLYVPSGVKIMDSTWTNLTAEKLVLNGVTVDDSGFRRHNIDSIYATDSNLGEGAFYVNSDSTNVVSTMSLNNTSVGTSCFYYNTFDDVSISGGTLGETAFTYTTTNNKLSLLDGVVIQNSNCFANRSYADHSASINYLYIDVPAVVVTAGSLRTGPFENCIFDVVEFGPSCTELRENCFLGASINTVKGLSNLKLIESKAFDKSVSCVTVVEPAVLTNAEIQSGAFSSYSSNIGYFDFDSLTLENCSVGDGAFYHQNFDDLKISGCTLEQYAFAGVDVLNDCRIINGTVFNDPLMFCIWNSETYTNINKLYVDVPVVPTTNTTQYARGVFKSANVNELELGPNCTEVARYSFYYLKGILNIKGLSYLKKIDEYAFSPSASYTISDEVVLEDATIGQYAFSRNNASCVLTFDSLTLDSCDIGAYAFARDGFGDLTICGESSLVGYSFLAITVTNEMQLMDDITFSSASYLFTSGSSVYPTINRLYVDTDLTSTTGSNYPFFNYAVISELEFGSGCTILYQKTFQSSSIGSIEGLGNIKTFGANCFATPQQMVSITELVSIVDAEIGDSAFKGKSATVYYEFSDLTLSGVTFVGTYNFYYDTFDSLLLSNGTVANTNYLFNCATINYLEVDSTSTATKAAFSYGSSNTAHSFIADAVIDMPTVPSGAFRYCGIEYLYLGDNVSTVESSAFYNCANINVSMPATCTYESNSFPSTVVITVRDGSEAQTLDLREEEQAEEEQEEVVEEETKEEENPDESTEETPSVDENGETPVEDGTGGEDASDEGTSGENTSNDNTSNEDTSNDGVSNEGSEGNQNPETSGDDGVSNENTPEDSTPDNTISGDSNGEFGSDSTTDEIVDGESNSGESSGESSDNSNEGTSNDASNDSSGETTPDDESGDVVVEGTETEGGNTSSEPVIPDNVGEDTVSGDETSSEEPVIDDTTSSNGEDEGTSSETTESETDTSVATPDENNNIESEDNEAESGVENVETPAVEENVSEGDSTTSDEDGESATENTSTPEVPASTESASNETSTSGETTSNSSETTSKKASNGSKETEVSSSSTPAESVSEAA